MANPVAEIPVTSDPEHLKRSIDQAIESINDLVRESDVVKYYKHDFPGTAITESISSATTIDSSVFYPVDVTGVSSIKLGSLIDGYCNISAKSNTVPVSGLEISNLASGVELKESEWVSVRDEEQEIQLQVRATGSSWEFGGSDLSTYFTVHKNQAGSTMTEGSGYVTAAFSSSMYNVAAISNDYDFAAGDLSVYTKVNNNVSDLYTGIVWDFDSINSFKYAVMGKYSTSIGTYSSGTYTDHATGSGPTYNNYRTLLVSITAGGYVTLSLDGSEKCNYDFGSGFDRNSFGMVAQVRLANETRSTTLDDLSLGGGSASIYSPYILTK